MTPYGKIAQYAIAAMSRLAQAHESKQRLRAAQIAESRDLPQPVIAKVLTVLSQAGLVTGSPGPGGGYALNKAPKDITLYDVAQLFERQEDQLSCPFGPNWCGTGPQCPLHHQLSLIREQIDSFLRTNTFERFLEPEQTPAAPPLPTTPLSLPTTPAPPRG